MESEGFTSHTDAASALARVEALYAQSLALLREGRLRVYEVAEQVGFGDYKNFAQAFRKYLAMTPSQFMQGL